MITALILIASLLTGATALAFILVPGEPDSKPAGITAWE